MQEPFSVKQIYYYLRSLSYLLLHVQIFFTITVAHICHVFSNELNYCLVRTSNFAILH